MADQLYSLYKVEFLEYFMEVMNSQNNIRPRLVVVI